MEHIEQIDLREDALGSYEQLRQSNGQTIAKFSFVIVASLVIGGLVLFVVAWVSLVVTLMATFGFSQQWNWLIPVIWPVFGLALLALLFRPLALLFVMAMDWARGRHRVTVFH